MLLQCILGDIFYVNQAEEAIMAKIKHIAIVTMDPSKLASFYQEVFDMKFIFNLFVKLYYL